MIPFSLTTGPKVTYPGHDSPLSKGKKPNKLGFQMLFIRSDQHSCKKSNREMEVGWREQKAVYCGLCPLVTQGQAHPQLVYVDIAPLP